MGDAGAGRSVGGLAATRDMELIADFAQTMRAEWTAIGLRAMYGYMADLATEPRWYRVHETFTEDADLAAEIVTTLVRNLQGESLNAGSVALTMKHFPGGGPQEGGGDPHYDYGKNQAYPSGNFEYHLKPFVAAIDAGVSAVMPYYGIPVGQPYMPNDVGMAFSKGIVTDLLRSRLGFKGYVNSDTGIIGDRAWGLEDRTIEEQLVISIDAGTDVLSGFDSNEQILDLVTSGRISEARLDESVRRLLREQFELGLFENPYVDPDRAAYLVGNRAFQMKAELAQRKSIVLLQNRENLLPLAVPEAQSTAGRVGLNAAGRVGLNAAGAGGENAQAATASRASQPRLYTMGVNADVAGDPQWGGFEVVAGDYDAAAGESRPAVPEGTVAAILRVVVSNGRGQGRGFGGAAPEELDLLSFSDMARSESWVLTPSLDDIRGVMSEIGPERTILAIRFRQPYVLDEASGARGAGAILATFGVSDAALMDVVTGRFNPSGKMPFALAGTAEAIVRQAPDAPGYDEADTLFPFGHGLSYETEPESAGSREP